MKHKSLTPLNPAFADTPLSKLITMLEQSCVFRAADIEDELDARLERIGKRWRFVAPGKIELYFPAKSRRQQQQPCNIGLFDTHARSQGDLTDLLL